MEFETIKKDNKKKYIIISVVVMLLASVVFFVGTKAKYRLTQKVNIASGTINWHPPVFSIVSIKTSSDGVNYSNESSVPASGYTLNNKSYCEVRGVKDTSITISYSNGNVTVNTSNINTKCYLYFDKKPTAKDQILATKTIDTSRSGSITRAFKNNTSSTSTTKGKIYSAEDDYGTSYVYAGVVNDNWVKFGKIGTNDIYWRIIRINGDGSIRMIYHSTSTNQTGGNAMGINSTRYYFATSSGSSDSSSYVGYMQGTSTSSWAKQKVDAWYNTNLNKEGIKEYISTEAGFCGDRGIYSIEQPHYYIYYAPYGRIGDRNNVKTSVTPTLKCGTSDFYTVSDSSKGNKLLTYPIGLITADEAVLAGGYGGSVGGDNSAENESYYLYVGMHYYTMSPAYYTGGSSVYVITSSGNIDSDGVSSTRLIRPVINLKPDVSFTGDGTTTNPFEIA